MAQEWWAADPVVGQQPSYPGVIQGPISQRRVNEEKRAEAADARSEESLNLQRDNANRDAERDDYKKGQDFFGNEQSLRKEFYSLPAVKEFQVASRTYANSLQAADDASGDQSLITAYAKMLDPGSVVREGEAASVANADSTIGRKIAALGKELGWSSGGQLSPEIRAKIRREMRTLAENYGSAYDLERKQFETYANDYGFVPNRVVGSHLMDPYRETIDSYWAAQEGQAKQPDMTGGVPTGSEIQFGMDGGNDGPFDRQAYLERQYGLKPGDEAKIVAFWNANAGNTQLTPEAVLGWYAQNNLNPPSGEDLAQGVEWAKSGDRFSGLNTSQAETEYVSKLDEAIGKQGIRPEDVSTTAGTGLAQGILLQGADEISGIGGGIRAAFNGEDPISAYQGERDIYRRIAERGQAENPGTALASEIGGSLVTGGVGFSGVRNVPQAFRAGAQMGGITGFNSGEGMGNSLAMLPIGAVAGGSLAAAGQKAMPYVANALNRVAPQRAPASADQLNIIAAGDRRGVPIRQADVRPEVRNQRGVVRTGERGGQIIRRTEEEDIASLENAVANDLGGASMPQDKESIGDTLQSVVDRLTEVSGKKAGAQYTRAHKLAGSAKIPPAQAIKAVDEQIAELTASGAKSNKGLIQYLTDIRDDLSVDGGLTIDALRIQRTNMRGQINERNLTSTDAERRIGMVLDAASADISRALSNNPRALQAFRQADQAWADRQRFLKQIGEKLIGPENNRKSGRAAASQIDSWLKGDFGRARRLWAEMENGERDALRATVVHSLGRNGRGEFSIGAFLSHTGSGKASILSPKAARLILGDDGMRALEDLRVIAGAKEAAANETNVSRTGNVVQATGRGLRNLMLASLGFSAGDVSGAVVAPAAGNFLSRLGEERAARMLVNPDFTKWLRTLPNTDQPAAINAQFQRLNSIASRSAIPTFQQDVRALQQHLMESFAQSPTRAAASEEEQN